MILGSELADAQRYLFPVIETVYTSHFKLKNPVTNNSMLFNITETSNIKQIVIKYQDFVLWPLSKHEIGDEFSWFFINKLYVPIIHVFSMVNYYKKVK